MNVKEYAEEHDMAQAEVKEKFGLTHWKQEVPESCDEIPEIAEDVDVSKEVVDARAGTTIEWKAKEEPKELYGKSMMVEAHALMKLLIKDGTTPEKALAGIRLIGKKCKWFEHKDALEMLV